MPLSPGEKLGPYEILAPIGAGGMGEVYRGRDTKLDREVAIKVLPASLAQDPERLARFEREAKVLASLNHPNIAQVYGLQEVEGGQALVMELVPGATLKGPVPLEQALHIAGQIAEALSAAHDKGITHRDLKPANVMMTPDDVVKVLDFGLAAVSQPSSAGEGNPSNSPTLTISPTRAGMILGTAAYMSPEQARGQTVDRRADIWAFGVLLWEILTGRQLFHGETVSDILASVLKDEPDFTQVPEQVRPLLKKCLQKDPKKRLQAIGDWELLVSDHTRQSRDQRERTDADAFLSAPMIRSLRLRLYWASITAGMLAVALAGVSYIGYRATRPAPLKPLARLDVDLGRDVSVGATYGASVALSPDGSRIAYVSNHKLHVRELNQPTATALSGTEGADAPFFSPDGKWVGFLTSSKLKKIEVSGGAPVELCDVHNGRGAAWGENGKIVVSTGATGELSQIPEGGGTPEALTRLEKGETSHRYPQVLLGGKVLLYTSYSGGSNQPGDGNVVVMALSDHRTKVLQRGGIFGRYVPTYGRTGHVTFVNKGLLYAVPFDPESLETTGTPVRVLDGVSYRTGVAEVSFAEGVTGPGTAIYRSALSGENRWTMQWLDSAGAAQALAAKPDGYMYPSLSPSGDRIAYSTADVWTYDIRRDITTRLSFDGGQFPLWSPDGRYIVFRKVGEGLLWTRADGGGKPKLLIEAKNQLGPTTFSPDGRRIVYQEVTGEGYDLWSVSVEVSDLGLKAGKPEPLLRTQINERQAQFSPDGHWLAYISDESGSYQVYVRAFPDNGSKWQISNDGGVYPRFSRTGHELFFRSEDSRTVFAVNYEAKTDAFVAGKPRVWLETQLADTQVAYFNYDVAPDGKRILALMPRDDEQAKQAQSHIIFLENFFDELKRKAPAK